MLKRKPKKPIKAKTKKRQRSPKQLMKESAWEWCSKYIRLKEGLITMGSKEYGKCFTCGKTVPLFKGRNCGQAGHLEEGRGNAILFEESGIRLQCKQCNLFKSGNLNVYRQKMLECCGQAEIDRLDALKKTTKNFTLEELTEIRDEYKDLYQEALANN